jgi:DCN1-like protein 1/2
MELWRVLFGSPSSPVQWNTTTTPFLDWWAEFLESKWKKSVNKDMWDQTLKFVEESIKDESLSWWSEEAAWPGVIDEFVEWIGEKRPKKSGEDEDMEMDY